MEQFEECFKRSLVLLSLKAAEFKRIESEDIKGMNHWVDKICEIILMVSEAFSEADLKYDLDAFVLESMAKAQTPLALVCLRVNETNLSSAWQWDCS